jgi:hypothetical protein
MKEMRTRIEEIKRSDEIIRKRRDERKEKK